ncbi:hypothetical protein HanIR_Chr15g0773151 [Helianthus annuus]|nr:hypothetical protein HanIR_Chr15g0773151 [Helianthus annuus]
MGLFGYRMDLCRCLIKKFVLDLVVKHYLFEYVYFFFAFKNLKYVDVYVQTYHL